ncbi:hypothetical protein BS17DRAFT_766097 [Gyrodon lividus]|nr:hypothetical protein BS17DRAFT_766097 [Gyrodon lividus]
MPSIIYSLQAYRCKEAYEAKKAWIMKEKETATEVKKVDKLWANAVKQAEKARIAAEKKLTKGKGCAVETPEGFIGAMEPNQATHVPEMDMSAITEKALPVPEGDEDIKFALHPDDPGNFLKLSSVLRLLIKHMVTGAEVNQADQLICQYCTELITMPKDSLLCEVAKIMLKASSEDCRTVAGLAALSKDLDEENPDELLQFDQFIGDRSRSLWFAQMCWFKSWAKDRSEIWDDFMVINVCLWEPEEYNKDI